ncbi:MAG: hypothetical protein ACREQL_02370 [Candidatus Binatia bacterium]
MARATGVMVLVLAVGIRSALAANPCEEGRERTGLSLVVRDGVLTVDAVDVGRAAATTGARAGDVVLQVNGVVPRSCAEYARAVEDARKGAKALLVLVGRPDGEVAFALGSRTWGSEEGTPAAAVASTPGAPAHRPVVAELPPPFPPDVPVSLDSVLAELGGLVGQTRQGLTRYREAVTNGRRGVETLAVRKAAPPGTVTALRRVARLHEVAAMAWGATDKIRERNGIPSRLPVSEALSAPYFSGSAEETAIDEFDFLRETVVSEPSGGRIAESSGEWRPVAARRLAWEHAGEALGGAAATLASGP